MHGPSSKSSSCHVRFGLPPALATALLVDVAPAEAGVKGRDARSGLGGVPSSRLLTWVHPLLRGEELLAVSRPRSLLARGQGEKAGVA